MDKNALALVLICIAAIFLAGCTSQAPQPVTELTTAPSPTVLETLPVDDQTCTTDADCVPAQCCHPTSCVKQAAKPVCDSIMCTMSCEGSLDCGVGSCGCTNGRCNVVPAQHPTLSVVTKTSVTLTASPQRYSPIMSSTPGIAISVDANGFEADRARFAWNATYGNFYHWGPVNYTVNEVGNPVTNQGEKLYWSYTDFPVSTSNPVIITVSATEIKTGRMLGSSRINLGWEENNAVTVKEII